MKTQKEIELIAALESALDWLNSDADSAGEEGLTTINLGTIHARADALVSALKKANS